MLCCLDLFPLLVVFRMFWSVVYSGFGYMVYAVWIAVIWGFAPGRFDYFVFIVVCRFLFPGCVWFVLNCGCFSYACLCFALCVYLVCVLMTCCF